MQYPELTSSLSRSIELVKSRSRKKDFTDEEMYPLYAVHSQTLEYAEIPESCQGFIGNPDAQIPPDLMMIYLQAISQFGLNTVVVPKHELVKYRERIAKKLGITVEDPFALSIEEMQDYVRTNGWTEVMNNQDGGSWLQTDKYERALKQGKEVYSMGVDLVKAYKSASKPKPNKKVEETA
jgi:hypothetical protein